MKTIRTYSVLLLASVLCLFFLCGCSVRENLDLIRSEADEIADFFREREDSRVPSLYASAASPDSPTRPLLLTKTHTEILPSPFNSPTNPATVASLGKSGEDFTTKTVTLTPEEVGHYLSIPRFTAYDVTSVSEALADYGIQPVIELRNNPAPAGRVFALEYAGMTDGVRYYINRDVPVTLYVSGQKPAKTAAEGDNLVYLTFDDGPTLKNTGQLLDILDLYGVKAAFFVTGDGIVKYPDAAREIVARGHLLGCHSMTHQYDRIYQNADALEEELNQWEKAVEDAGIVLTHKLFRFPGGSVSNYLTDYKRTSMTQMLTERGYRIYDWNVVTNDSLLSLRPDGISTYDYIRETFEETLSLCVRENQGKTGSPVLILMHETVEETVALMPWMLEKLIREGYTFGSFDQMDSSWTFADRK